MRHGQADVVDHVGDRVASVDDRLLQTAGAAHLADEIVHCAQQRVADRFLRLADRLGQSVHLALIRLRSHGRLPTELGRQRIGNRAHVLALQQCSIKSDAEPLQRSGLATVRLRQRKAYGIEVLAGASADVHRQPQRLLRALHVAGDGDEFLESNAQVVIGDAGRQLHLPDELLHVRRAESLADVVEGLGQRGHFDLVVHCGLPCRFQGIDELHDAEASNKTRCKVREVLLQLAERSSRGSALCLQPLKVAYGPVDVLVGVVALDDDVDRLRGHQMSLNSRSARSMARSIISPASGPLANRAAFNPRG